MLELPAIQKYLTKSALVFIDSNGNGTFDNNDRVGASNYTRGTFSLTINFSVPCSAVAGKTRLRIVCQENTAAAITACGTYAYAATEDYNVNVLPQSPQVPTSPFQILFIQVLMQLFLMPINWDTRANGATQTSI
jgi:hypothetical protein